MSKFELPARETNKSHFKFLVWVVELVINKNVQRILWAFSVWQFSKAFSENRPNKYFPNNVRRKVSRSFLPILYFFENFHWQFLGNIHHFFQSRFSTSLLSSLVDQLDVRTAASVQLDIWFFNTLHLSPTWSIPHDLLKSRISNLDLVHNAFRKKDGSVRYTHIKVTREKGYFTHYINGSGDSMYTAGNICKMIEFLIDNIFVQFGGRLFR